MKTNHFKILKETKSKVVKWDIEMSEDLRSSLEREGFVGSSFHPF